MKQSLYLLGHKLDKEGSVQSTEHVLAKNLTEAKTKYCKIKRTQQNVWGEKVEVKVAKSLITMISKMDFDKNGILIKKKVEVKAVEMRARRKVAKKKKKVRRRRTNIVRY